MVAAIQCFERLASEGTKGLTTDSKSSASLPYRVKGTDSEDRAIAATIARSPAFFRGLNRSGVSYTLIGYQLWDTVAQYGEPQDNQDQENEEEDVISFDTTGGTEKIKLSLGTRIFGNGRVQDPNHDGKLVVIPPPDFYGSINVEGEGSEQTVNGVEIVAPKLKLSYKHAYQWHEINDEVVKTWAGCVGRVNKFKFKTYEAGELLYLGATGSGKRLGLVSVEHHFAASKNITEDLKYGHPKDPITVKGGKKGWEYLWPYFEPVHSGEAMDVLHRPLSVYLETVYYEVDFAVLGLGASTSSAARPSGARTPRAA